MSKLFLSILCMMFLCGVTSVQASGAPVQSYCTYNNVGQYYCWNGQQWILAAAPPPPPQQSVPQQTMPQQQNYGQVAGQATGQFLSGLGTGAYQGATGAVNQFLYGAPQQQSSQAPAPAGGQTPQTSGGSSSPGGVVGAVQSGAAGVAQSAQSGWSSFGQQAQNAANSIVNRANGIGNMTIGSALGDIYRWAERK